MKNASLFLLMVLFSSFAAAQTIHVGGTQSGVWDADTVLVIDDVKVKDSLMILPGTVVLFDGFYSITVKDGAVFKAQGKEADSVFFTVSDTTGFHLYDSGRGGWNGFQLRKAGKVLLDYCVLEYGKAADEKDQHGGALEIIGCDDVEVSNSTFHCNTAREHGGALNAEDSHVVLTDCRVVDNRLYTEDTLYYMYGGAFRFLKCDVVMRGMEFRRNEGEICIGGALSLDSCSVVLDRAVFAENIGLNGAGLYLMRSNHLECRFSNLLFDGNLAHHFAGGLAFSDSSPDVYNMLVTNNDSEGVTCSGVFFYQYSSPRLTNCIIYGNYPGETAGNPDTAQMWVWTFEDYAPEFRNCVIEGDTNYFIGYGYVKVYEDILDVDPLFVDAEHHDFHLQEESPCRDAGNRFVPLELLNGTDLDGNSRVKNNRIDIGPYESSPASVPKYPQQDFVKLMGNPLGLGSRLVMELDQKEEVVIKVYSSVGRESVVKTFDGEAGANTIEIGDLVGEIVPGIYLIEIITNDKVCTLKAVK